MPIFKYYIRGFCAGEQQYVKTTRDPQKAYEFLSYSGLARSVEVDGQTFTYVSGAGDSDCKAFADKYLLVSQR